METVDVCTGSVPPRLFVHASIDATYFESRITEVLLTEPMLSRDRTRRKVLELFVADLMRASACISVTFSLIP